MPDKVYDLTVNEAIKSQTLGARIVINDKIYRYVQIHASGTAPSVGMWLYRYAIATEWVLSATPESLLSSVFVTGVCTTALTAGNFGWIQTGGPNDKMYTNNSSTGAAATGYVAIPCSTAGGVKWVNPFTNTEYTNAMLPTLACAESSETSQATTAGLILGYIAGRILIDGDG